jgi:hypothetical protein
MPGASPAYRPGGSFTGGGIIFCTAPGGLWNPLTIQYFEDGGTTYHNRYSFWEIVRGQEGDHWKVTPELLQNQIRPQNPEAVYFESTGNLHRHDTVNRTFFTSEGKTPPARTFTTAMEFMDRNHGEDNWFLQKEFSVGDEQGNRYRTRDE